MPRYKLTIEYDGTGLAGWQKQAGLPSVQDHIEWAITQFSGEDAELFAAGRTDAGVHALAQVAHVDLVKEFEAFTVMRALNQYLKERDANVAIIAAESVADDFHARFSATRRHYRYRIVNRRSRLALDRDRAWQVPLPLDVALMQKAANLLIGTHDFTSFRDTDCQSKSPVKTLDSLTVTRAGEEIIITTDSRSFLHHQVRIMVGTLTLVGNGKWRPSDIIAALEARDRRAAGPTAPAQGLYLTQVEY